MQFVCTNSMATGTGWSPDHGASDMVRCCSGQHAYATPPIHVRDMQSAWICRGPAPCACALAVSLLERVASQRPASRCVWHLAARSLC